CRRPFDFAAGETALVLRHVAYGFDFVHDHDCLSAAQALIFAEPGYDCAAFARDPERRRVVNASDASGWTAVLPDSAEQALACQPVHSEPLRCWAHVEYQDGSRSTEGNVRDAEGLGEPGSAQVPEAVRGQRQQIAHP